MIYLEAHWLKLVCTLLREHLPSDCKVRVFGSRLTPQHKLFADLDLALDAAYPLLEKTLATLSEAFDESLLPIKVDLLELAKASPEFQKIVLAKHEVLLF